MQLQAELFPKRKPTGIRVWAVYPNGARQKLFEQRGGPIADIIGLGQSFLQSIKFPPRPRPKKMKSVVSHPLIPHRHAFPKPKRRRVVVIERNSTAQAQTPSEQK